MPIEYQPFSTFRSTVQQLVAPEDLAEQLEAYFRDQVGNALCDIQTLIPWFRSMNVQLFGKADLNEFCAASIFQGPVGKVTQLFAYKPGVDCKKFYYKRSSVAAVDCWMERQRCVLCKATTPPSHNIYDSPYCNYFLDGEAACEAPYLITPPEDDCRFQRLDDDDRIFAVGSDYKIYAAPRFPCGYNILLQWQGVNRKWNGVDLVPVDQQLREAVVDYVEHKVAMKEKDPATASQYFEAYTMIVRTLMRLRYQDEQQTEAKRDCSSGIEQLTSSTQTLYPTGVYSPGGGGSSMTVVQGSTLCGDGPPASNPPDTSVCWSYWDKIADALWYWNNNAPAEWRKVLG